MLSDGGRRSDDTAPGDVKVSGGGWVLWVAFCFSTDAERVAYATMSDQVGVAQQRFEYPLRARRDGRVSWLAIACSSFHVGACTSMQAEARAALQGLHAACGFLNEGRVHLRPSGFLDLL